MLFLKEPIDQMSLELNDRANDNWQHLFAIAQLAGERWSAFAKNAALSLSGTNQEQMTIGIQLLRDIKAILLEARGDRITTEDLLHRLNSDEEAPWRTYRHNTPLTAHDLAKLLREFSIASKTIRLSNEVTRKGYYCSSFKDPFERYLPETAHRNCETGDTSSQVNEDGTSDGG